MSISNRACRPSDLKLGNSKGILPFTSVMETGTKPRRLRRSQSEHQTVNDDTEVPNYSLKPNTLKVSDNRTPSPSRLETCRSKLCQLKQSPSKQVVYYQNRFMVLESIPLPALNQENTSATAKSIQENSLRQVPYVTQASNKQCTDRLRSNQCVQRLDIDSKELCLAPDVNTRCSRNEGNCVTSPRADDSCLVSREVTGACCATVTNTCTTKMEMDASSVTMDARAIEIVITDEADRSRRVDVSKKESIWRKISRALIDNRMTGQTDCDQVLRPHPEENIVLKKILNILFIVIGVCLLVAVFIVIIYTAIVGDEPPYPQETVRPSINTVSSQNNETIKRVERNVALKPLEWIFVNSKS